MIMGYWNGMRWEVSSREIAYLESLTTAYSIDTDTNADKEGQKPTESVGISLMEVSFSTTYRIETGTPDIRSVLEQWKTMIGKAAPLIIGNAIFGPDKMQLQFVSVSNVEISPKGIIRAATCAFKLKEFAEEPSGTKKQSNKSSSSSGKAGTATAITVGVRHSDKAQKKTVSIE